MAIWKTVAGYEGYYEVSNEGEVRSVERVIQVNNNGTIYNKRVRTRILAQATRDNGYKAVLLSKDGIHENFLVHRLVAIAFVPNPDDLPEVNHKHEDGDKTRNFDWNLEWTTHSGNAIHGIHVLGRQWGCITLKE